MRKGPLAALLSVTTGAALATGVVLYGVSTPDSGNVKPSTTQSAPLTPETGKTKGFQDSTTPTPAPEQRKLIAVQVNISDNGIYGQAMPVVVHFDRSIPMEQRPALEKLMAVRVSPYQAGAWHWFDGNHAEYRPEKYWQPGSLVTLDFRLAGTHIGEDAEVASDVVRSFRTDTTARVILVSNATKTLTAYQNGEPVKEIPVSLGKSVTPTPYGQLVIMEKLAKTIMDSSTFGVPTNSPGGYRLEVFDAQRVTYGGVFIHAAPWSVADQGKTNVSHGCINISPENAKWLMGFTRVGDPVVITGTEAPVKLGDGWTVWTVPWGQM